MVGGERAVSCASARVRMTDGEPAGRRSRKHLFLSPLPVPDDVPALGPEEPAGTEEETPQPAPTRLHRPAALLLVAVALVAAVAVIGDDEGESDGNASGKAIATTTTEIIVVELDTGAARSVPAEGAGMPDFAWATGSSVVVQSPEGVLAVPVRPRQDPVVLVDRGSPSSVVPSDRPGRVWLLTHGQGSLKGREVTIEGHDTGRRFSLRDPVGGATLVAVGGGFVVEAFGSLSLFDPDTGDVRAAGHGIPLAASGDTLARLSCAALRCGLHLTDLRNDGDVEVIMPEGTVMPFAGPVFSPDRRWLAVGMGTATGGPNAVALVDVADGRVAAVQPTHRGEGSTFAFSPDSHWLFVLVGVHDVVAHRVDTGEVVTLERFHRGGAIALAAVALAE